MKIENIVISNIEGALRGMRNPMNSWDKSDSCYNNNHEYIIGNNDLNLCLRLISAGSEHRKFLRQMFVSIDISAARYWWSEFDTYKIGTVANSCSTMHKLTYKKFDLSDYELDYIKDDSTKFLVEHLTILNNTLNKYRDEYLETKDFNLIILMKRILPESYIQKRTITMNYEILMNMYKQRKFHRLKEWTTFCDWIKTIPYMDKFLIDK